jgi:cupin fold WbuC family metalloprotein
MKLIDLDLLDSVTEQAQSNQRLRMNYNFHETLESKAQRLLNALEPGTILPIHRHGDTSETYIILRGSLRVVYYNNAKEIIKSEVLSHQKDTYGVHIPAGQFHTIEVLETGTVIFEVKDGPYTPIEEKDIL